MPSKLTLTVHHRSDAGRVRAYNQDYRGYRQPKEPEVRAEAGWLYAVADGVGGAQQGEVASKLAVQTLLAAYYRTYRETPADRLQKAFAETNRAVHEQASQQEGPHRMSTTLVAAVIRAQELTVANVGDSRAYLIRDGQMRQITHDHSVVAELMAEGVITPEQAEHHPQRKVISRSLGARPEVEADVFTEAFHPGDRLLLCSDGLTEHVTEAEILTAMQMENPEDSVQRLINLANEGGGTDNITVLVVRALREREDRLPSLVRSQEIEKRPAPRRISWPWVGAIVTVLLICIAGLAAGAVLLFKPTPTPTPTATPTLIPVLATSTATATTIPTPTYPPTFTPLPTASDTATPPPTEMPAPTPKATDTPLPTLTATASPTATDTPSPTETETASPTMADTQTPTPTVTETSSPTPTETLTPTATSTSEMSPLPTPTLTPTPTSTSEVSPPPRPTP
jgi:serine/threonine protein phosphatase PrpC